MADAFSQNLTIWRGADTEIQLTGAAADFSEAPTAWALSFDVSKNRGKTPDLTVTSITVTGSGPYVASIPLTRAQTAALVKDEYDWTLMRTDLGGVSPKANGKITVQTPVYPLPVA